MISLITQLVSLKYNGSVTFFSPIEQGIDVDVFVYYNDGNKSEQWDFKGGNESYNVGNVDSVAVIPHLNDCFAGIKSMDLSTFSNKGNMNGNVAML